MHLLTANGSRVLLDCGLYQGKRAEAFERNRNFPFDASTINAVVLSHAHIDHAGNLPNLVRNGFEGTIFATSATRDLCGVMLYDSAYLQERDAEYVNKQHAKRREPSIEPIYTSEDVEQTMAQMVGVRYRQKIDVADGISITFVDAGHVLGSAVTLIEVKENGKITTLGFSGDLGRKNMPILKDPEPIGDVDIWITESTYGGRIHEPISGMEQRLLSRFKWGLLADLQRPDYETRLAILKKKAYNDGIELPEEIFEFLAANISNNIRELEAVLISLYAQSTLNRKEITLDLARLMVEKLISTSRREITIEYIQKIVCDYYKIPIDLIQGKTRKREIVQARQVSMFFSKNLTKASLASIGSHIGGKDHATVLHACKTVNNLIDTDKHFRNQITEIEKKLKV